LYDNSSFVDDLVDNACRGSAITFAKRIHSGWIDYPSDDKDLEDE
jgi:hypothetical protein